MSQPSLDKYFDGIKSRPTSCLISRLDKALDEENVEKLHRWLSSGKKSSEITRALKLFLSDIGSDEDVAANAVSNHRIGRCSCSKNNAV